MVSDNTNNTSIQAFFALTRAHTLSRQTLSFNHDGDGFTSQEVREAVRSEQVSVWHPTGEYSNVNIGEVTPGPGRVTFMGRVANIYDIMHTPKSEKAAKGGLKICVKDSTAAITVRLWYATAPVQVRLGSLVSVWAAHVSNGENGGFSSHPAPYFVSIFPERDHSCYFRIHNNNDDRQILRTPLGLLTNRPLSSLMTLQNFIDGGYDVHDARILVVVKSIGARKTLTRQDGTKTSSVMVRVHDDTANATLGLYGTSSMSPFALNEPFNDADRPFEGDTSSHPWRPDQTVLMLQSSGWSLGRGLFLKLQSSTIVDTDPEVTDAHWLRKWAVRKKSREAINPPFPNGVFDLDALKHGMVRALFTIAELDDFARAAPNETFKGYLSVLLVELRLVEHFRRKSLMSGECCNIPVYANATESVCKGCDKHFCLRLNPKIIGRVVDETAHISTGKLSFSDQAWGELLGRAPADLLKLGKEDITSLADRLLFNRVTLLFGWSNDDGNAGGRIWVLGVRS
ncbi:hypothetical protein K431DRAFT_259573 [Polychaeton citri CBS 116435]|uniref:Nucleic acid-binding protein n=1 Tax=Polychaeton citri CBS 116435 TaxID=1314669 RepID=A0A9P4UUK4_9PEZI|nr:hypothetical protein K431DRAFT_259573 [Polychaeton citri CBS 116435]